MIELEPCPFCGGDAELMDYYPLFQVRCSRCWATRAGLMHTKEEAAQRWNTRHVETCYSERTDCFECVECGFFDAYAAPDAFHYCPGCGRKVEE